MTSKFWPKANLTWFQVGVVRRWDFKFLLTARTLIKFSNLTSESLYLVVLPWFSCSQWIMWPIYNHVNCQHKCLLRSGRSGSAAFITMPFRGERSAVVLTAGKGVRVQCPVWPRSSFSGLFLLWVEQRKWVSLTKCASKSPTRHHKQTERSSTLIGLYNKSKHLSLFSCLF